MYFGELALEKRAFANYCSLDAVCKRKVKLYDDIAIEFHFNPARVKSVMAKVDAETIRNRQCFLCPEGIGTEQLTSDWTSPVTAESYWIRVNPFPIFHRHFTISATLHTRQQIAGRYQDMLALAEAMPKYIIFYNGPKCGASAPDHFHFQAFPKGNLPVEKMLEHKCGYKTVIENEKFSIYEINSYIRGGYVITSKDDNKMAEIFDFLCENGKIHTSVKQPDEKPNESPEWEPRMNVVSWKKDGLFTTIIFFREESRPACFWDEREGYRIYISPGTVEMAGTLLTSDRNTFEKTPDSMLASILKEVSLDGNYADYMNESILNKYTI